jgi:hypothetical protein
MHRILTDYIDIGIYGMSFKSDLEWKSRAFGVYEKHDTIFTLGKDSQMPPRKVIHIYAPQGWPPVCSFIFFEHDGNDIIPKIVRSTAAAMQATEEMEAFGYNNIEQLVLTNDVHGKDAERFLKQVTLSTRLEVKTLPTGVF